MLPVPVVRTALPAHSDPEHGQFSQVAQQHGDAAMRHPKCFLIDRECALKEGLCLRILFLRDIEDRQMIETGGHIRMMRSQAFLLRKMSGYYIMFSDILSLHSIRRVYLPILRDCPFADILSAFCEMSSVREVSGFCQGSIHSFRA